MISKATRQFLGLINLSMVLYFLPIIIGVASAEAVEVEEAEVVVVVVRDATGK